MRWPLWRLNKELPLLAPVGQQAPPRPGRVWEDVGGGKCEIGCISWIQWLFYFKKARAFYYARERLSVFFEYSWSCKLNSCAASHAISKWYIRNCPKGVRGDCFFFVASAGVFGAGANYLRRIWIKSTYWPYHLFFWLVSGMLICFISALVAAVSYVAVSGLIVM